MFGFKLLLLLLLLKCIVILYDQATTEWIMF